MPNGSSLKATAIETHVSRADAGLASSSISGMHQYVERSGIVQATRGTPPSPRRCQSHQVRELALPPPPKAFCAGPAPTRRAMRAERAAAYFDVSESTFLSWVKQGIMPAPTRINGCVLWCIRQLDTAFDRLCSNSDAENEWNGVFQ